MNNFFIIVGKGGTFQPEDDQTIPDPGLGVYVSEQDVDAMFSHLIQQNIPKMAIHFHGGLVNQAAGIEAAIEVAKTLRSAGSFPVAFIWKTGLIETIRRFITDSQNSTFFGELKRIILKNVAKKLGAKVGAKGIDSLTDAELDFQLMQEEPFEDVDFNEGEKSATKIRVDSDQIDLESEIQADMEADIEEFARFVPGISEADNPHLDLAKIGEPERQGTKGAISTAKLVKAAVAIVISVIKRFAKGIDHGFYATVVEEIYRELYVSAVGQVVWGNMKNKAWNMWKSDPTPLPANTRSHVGSYFLIKLDQHMKANPGFQVDLIGHSAGSIVICELLRTLNNYSNVKIRNVIFLAPACDANLFHPAFSSGNVFGSFYLFTMADKYERKDRLVPVLYPHSLLYFISGLLESKVATPLLGLERYFDSLGGLNQYLSTRQTLSVTAPGGKFNSSCRKHGDFDNDAGTLASIGAIIK